MRIMNWLSLTAISTSSPDPTIRATSWTALRGTIPDIAGPAPGSWRTARASRCPSVATIRSSLSCTAKSTPFRA